MMRGPRFATRGGALIVALVPLAVYVLTLQNGLTPGELRGGDPITHQYAQATLRFSNAPGYPIFSALGWVWFQLSAWLTPFFNPIERLTFYSTLYAIPSLVLLYYLILELTGHGQAAYSKTQAPGPVPTSGERIGDAAAPHLPPGTAYLPLAILATLFFAFSYFFWYYSISSENYSSGTLNTLAIIALALRWQRRRDEGTLLWLCFVCGLSLAHLLTVALAVPAVILFVVGQEPGYLRRPKLLAAIAIVTFLPLLSYAYVYWRGAEHPEWRGQGSWTSTWAWFVDFIRTQQGQAELTWSWDGIPWNMLALIANELTLLVFAGGVAGLFLLPRWRAALFIGILAIYLPEMYLDRYGNWFQTVIALYPVFIIGFAVLVQRGADRAAAWLSHRPAFVGHFARAGAGSGERQIPRLPHRTPGKAPGQVADDVRPSAGERAAWLAAWLVATALSLGLALLVLNRLLVNYAADNLRDRPTATGLNPGWTLLADQPLAGARIVGAFDEDLSLDYLTQVWGAQPPVKPAPINQVNALLGQPLYASRAAMPLVTRTLSPTAHLSAQGLNLVALLAVPASSVPAAAQIAPHALGHGLELTGALARAEPARQHLSLYWRAARPIDVDMSVSVRLMQAEQIISQADSASPVGGYYPMSRWQTGEVVRDDYALPAGADSAPNRAHIILYHPVAGGFENLAEWDVPVGR